MYDSGNPTIDDLFTEQPFLDGPTDALVEAVVAGIKAVPEFQAIFLDSIDSYERIDYPIRALPALRIFNERFTKEHESHYITGELVIDVIFPASLRREENQRAQDIVCAALVQQFRRPSFFAEMRSKVPGLNELGKTYGMDKTLGLAWQDGILPVTRTTPNFRIDLKEWDAYLEREGRTKDDPFKVTLGNLQRIISTINGIRGTDPTQVDAEIQIDQNIGG